MTEGLKSKPIQQVWGVASGGGVCGNLRPQLPNGPGTVGQTRARDLLAKGGWNLGPLHPWSPPAGPQEGEANSAHARQTSMSSECAPPLRVLGSPAALLMHPAPKAHWSADPQRMGGLRALWPSVSTFPAPRTQCIQLRRKGCVCALCPCHWCQAHTRQVLRG